MDPIFRHLFSLYQVSGLYFGPPQSKSELLRWPECYKVTVTACLTLYSLVGLCACLFGGREGLYRRAGADFEQAKQVIDEMKPITGVTTIANAVIYFAVCVINYWTTVTKGRQMMRLARSSLYKSLGHSKRTEVAILCMLLAHALFSSITYQNSLEGWQWYLVFGYSFISTFHYHSEFVISLYFLLQNIRYLRQECRLLVAGSKLKVISLKVDRMVKTAGNVDRLNVIMSLSMGAQLVNLINQVAFNLFYIVFQNQPPIFVNNVFTLLGIRATCTLVMCLQVEVIINLFNRICRYSNEQFSREAYKRHWRCNANFVHFRVKTFLLHNEKSRFRIRVLPNVQLDLPQLLQTAFFSFNLSIIFYSTEFM